MIRQKVILCLKCLINKKEHEITPDWLTVRLVKNLPALKPKWDECEEGLTLRVPNPDKEKKLSQIFIFTLPCDASKGFMKAFMMVCSGIYYEVCMVCLLEL